ncbi:MAG: hypothetical protein K8S54_13640 [Spirochaetia bacterium]|nr:hypothetical protein [Spirochaetia bacterium]
MVKSEKIHNPTAFSVLATGLGGRIPTRVNHQLIYGEPGEKSALNGTINVSLANRSVFTPDYKKGYRWGQFLRSAEYESRLGLCLDSPDGSEDKVTIEFYTTQGLVVSHAVMLKPGTAAIFKISEILKHEEELEFGWFIAKCDRADLTAYCFHYHKHSCNASGEHSF